MKKAYISMRKLRRGRRRKGLCAQCGNPSKKTYLCPRCKEAKNQNDAYRLAYRKKHGLCLRCGKPRSKTFDLCPVCLEREIKDKPMNPIRKLNNWTIKNQELYKAMEEFYCTTSELGNKVRAKVRTVQKWLYEGATPRLQMALRVARVFNKPVELLFPKYKTIRKEEC